jgi:hypothetical protein
MRERLRAEMLARVLLTLGALLPYWPLLTFGTIYVTDDFFASDIFNGELPGRVLTGQLVRQGQLPLWANQLCSGMPLAGGVGEPLGLAAFSLLSPAAALDLAGPFLEVRPALVTVLRTLGVSHLLSGFAVTGANLPLVSQHGWAHIYRIDGAARVRLVRAARHVNSEEEAAGRLLGSAFDPDGEVLLQGAPKTVRPIVQAIAGAPKPRLGGMWRLHTRTPANS